jgi:hypothetical protein
VTDTWEGHAGSCAWQHATMAFLLFWRRGMTIANTHGLAFIGPESEWFWTGVSGLVLLVTFLAIDRQLRLQAGARLEQALRSTGDV